MAYIYKTGRTELYEQIRRHAHLITGKALDVGAGGYPRYQHLFTTTEYVKMETTPGPEIDLVGRVENIPAPEKSFDSIVCTQVLGDVYHLAKAFAEFHRVLRSQGIILITENLFDPLHDQPQDFWRFTPHSLTRLAEEAGFKIKVLERRGGYWSVMAQLKARYWIERTNANQKWFARLFSFGLKILGTSARFLDQRDHSRANQLFTHGYLLIAQKYD